MKKTTSASLIISLLVTACGNNVGVGDIKSSTHGLATDKAGVQKTHSSSSPMSTSEADTLKKSRFVQHTFSNGEVVDWENDGEFIIRNGDILVTSASEIFDKVMAHETKIHTMSANNLNSQSLVLVPTRSCVLFFCSTSDKRWVGSVAYSYAPGLPQEKIDAVDYAVRSWNTTMLAFGTPIKWTPNATAANRVVFTNLTDPGACGNSFVGMQGGVQNIGVGSGNCLGIGVIQHEMLHAVGVEHEQQRCDRDAFITVVGDQYIQPARRSQFTKLCDVGHQTKSFFDYDSVMLYGPTVEYSTTGYTPVITVPATAPANSSGTPQNYGQRSGMSYYDVNGLRQLY